MPDMMQTGISGLRASQRGLATTSHNISNVNTDGFSRQRVEQDTNMPHYYARGAVGTGTQVQTIQRLSEDTRIDALRRNHAEFERLDTLREMTGRIDNLVADKDAGLSPAMRDFFDAVEEVANDPANTVSKQQLITRGQALADRFGTMDNRLLGLQEDVDRRIERQTEQVNGHAQAIAELNQEIRRRWSNPQRPPNDLLDQRDEQIRQLSELVTVRVHEQDDRSLNVAIGTGQPLVTGDRTNELRVVHNPFDPQRPELAVDVGKRELIVTERIQGGALGGLVEFRSGVLDQTRDEIGRVATSLAVALNVQHGRGIQFDSGDPARGEDFFNLAEVGVAAHARNESDALPKVEIDSELLGGLNGENYLLRYDGKNDQWRLTAMESGQVRHLGKEIPAEKDGRFRFDGLVVELPDGAKDGDEFQILPTRDAAGSIEGRLTRPTQVAAAAPVTSGEALSAQGQSSNTGRGYISEPTVGRADGVMADLEEESGVLRYGVVLEYREDDQGSYFQVYAQGEEIPGARLAYTPDDVERGEAFNLSNVEGLESLDIEVRLSGAPDPGDRFEIRGNTEGVGDNTNALQMAELMNDTIMDNGNSTFQETYSAMVGELGGFSQRVQTNHTAQQTLLYQAQEQWEELAGVNLDEEAANMMEYQRSYQAAARIITAADEVFQELLAAVRR